jgi:hypothetical protein|tara:strand:+ start:473 stop:1015 length:543 start_codon:yes stop_codon:yes gene_type:complete
MNRKVILNICFYFFFVSCFSQIENSNQISINGDNIFPFLFNSSNTTYNLGYRKTFNEKISLRFGIRYLYKSDDALTIGIKPGIDWVYKKVNNWTFYYGVDTSLELRDDMARSNKFNEVSIIPFFGILCNLDKHFSISIEPSFYIKYEKNKDYSNNIIVNTNSMFSSGMSELGIVYLNFHF